MSYTFAVGSSQNIHKTTPVGFVVVANWTVLFWFKLGTLNTSDGNIIIRVGPQGSTTRGFIIRLTAAGVLNYYDGHTNLSGTTVLTSGTFYRISVTRDNATGKIAINVNGTQEAFDTSGTNPTEIQAGDVYQISDTDTNGYHYLDGSMSWVGFVQGVTMTATAADNYLNQTGGKNPCALVTDYGTSGGITANALKDLWPLGTSSPFTDLSGVGNDGTAVNAPTNSAQPSGLGEACSSTYNVAITEAASAADSSVAGTTTAAVIAEAASAADSSTAVVPLVASITEAANAQDVSNGGVSGSYTLRGTATRVRP